jgi:hypothetical protein
MLAALSLLPFQISFPVWNISFSLFFYILALVSVLALVLSLVFGPFSG